MRRTACADGCVGEDSWPGPVRGPELGSERGRISVRSCAAVHNQEPERMRQCSSAVSTRSLRELPADGCFDGFERLAVAQDEAPLASREVAGDRVRGVHAESGFRGPAASVATGAMDGRSCRLGQRRAGPVALAGSRGAEHRVPCADLSLL